jgi:hypothetical protein
MNFMEKGFPCAENLLPTCVSFVMFLMYAGHSPFERQQQPI